MRVCRDSLLECHEFKHVVLDVCIIAAAVFARGQAEPPSPPPSCIKLNELAEVSSNSDVSDNCSARARSETRAAASPANVSKALGGLDIEAGLWGDFGRGGGENA